MDEADAQTPPRRAWPWWLALPVSILLAPFVGIYLFLFVLPVLLLATMVAALTPIWLRFSNHRLARRMAAAGRRMTLHDVESQLARGPGTIIFDFPELGWSVTHVWWLPGSVALESNFHDWEPDVRAMLVATDVSGRVRVEVERTVESLQLRFPNLWIKRTHPKHLESFFAEEMAQMSAIQPQVRCFVPPDE